MEHVDAIYAGYKEKPKQGAINRQGNTYLDKNFPLMSYIETAEQTPIVVDQNATEP